MVYPQAIYPAVTNFLQCIWSKNYENWWRVDNIIACSFYDPPCNVFVCLKFVVVLLPADVDHEVAACCIGDGVRAYIALQHLGHVSFGDTVLIMDAATSFGSLAVQLAHAWGAKVRFAVYLDVGLWVLIKQ